MPLPCRARHGTDRHKPPAATKRDVRDWVGAAAPATVATASQDVAEADDAPRAGRTVEGGPRSGANGSAANAPSHARHRPALHETASFARSDPREPPTVARSTVLGARTRARTAFAMRVHRGSLTKTAEPLHGAALPTKRLAPSSAWTAGAAPRPRCTRPARRARRSPSWLAGPWLDRPSPVARCALRLATAPSGALGARTRQRARLGPCIGPTTPWRARSARCADVDTRLPGPRQRSRLRAAHITGVTVCASLGSSSEQTITAVTLRFARSGPLVLLGGRGAVGRSVLESGS
jgi:hypothetical protein